MKHEVTLLYDASKSISVDASTAGEALEKAYEQIGWPSLCHHCSSEIELGDVYGHIITPEVGEALEAGFVADSEKYRKQRDQLAGLLAKYSKRGLSPVLTEDELEEIEAAIAAANGGEV